MKKVISILIILCNLNLSGQEKYNQLSESGLKVGEWPEFYSNGKLKLINLYDQPYRMDVNDKGVAFQLGLKTEDTIIYFERFINTDHYEYDENWNLTRIRRVKLNDGRNLYLYGEGKEIGLYKEREIIKGRVLEEFEIEFPLINYADKDLTLTPHIPYGNVLSQTTPIVLSKNDTTQVKFKVRLEPGSHNYNFSLKRDSVSIELQILTFGYHIKSDDFKSSGPVKIHGDTFIYYRTGDEALLKLYDFEKSNELMAFSLAFQKKEISLKQLEAGQYWLQIIDYANDRKEWLLLELSQNE